MPMIFDGCQQQFPRKKKKKKKKKKNAPTGKRPTNKVPR